ncbi:uncharacterized protein [Drosophila takahashii]|uniref:uncharacterized protein n=1 Tax=Drosophila takahashii TaxID=29030 RepID=UPI003898D996
MKEVSDADSKMVEISKKTQEEEPLRLEDPKSGEEPTTHRSKEVFLRKHSYTSPDSTSIKEDKNCETETSENKYEITVNSAKLKSNPLPDQESLSYLSVSLHGECRPQDTHNKCDGNIGIHSDISRLSEVSFDSEFNSDSSEELFEDDIMLKKKKKRDLVKTERLEDPEEEFRRHFLKTFQDLPRISQISLDGEPKKNKSKEQNWETERNAEENPSISNENIEQLTENNNSRENFTEDLTKEGETTTNIQEEDVINK